MDDHWANWEGTAFLKIWTIKKLCTAELLLLTMVLEKTLESPLDSKEVKPVNPKGNQP